VLTETETLTRFEIMDGAPIRGERIPIRMFLAGIDAQPTLVAAANCLSVRYFLNLVLIDEEDRRYFKQQEATFYRAAIAGGPRSGAAATAATAAAPAAAPALFVGASQ